MFTRSGRNKPWIQEKIVVSTVDTDVIVILLGVFTQFFSHSEAIQIWVEFGKGKQMRYFDLNSIFNKLGPRASNALPFFHS